MSGGRKWFLSLFMGHKKQKVWNKTREKYMPEGRRQNLAETDRGSYYKHKELLEAFLDNKSTFSNGSESDDHDNDDENYNGNIEALAHRCFSNLVFLKILLRPATLLKTDSEIGVFLWNLNTF